MYTTDVVVVVVVVAVLVVIVAVTAVVVWFCAATWHEMTATRRVHVMLQSHSTYKIGGQSLITL